MTHRKRLERILFYSALACLLWGFVIEPGLLFFERRAEVRIKGWPAEFDGLRIAVVSDLHTGSPLNGRRRLRSVVRTVNASNAGASSRLKTKRRFSPS